MKRKLVILTLLIAACGQAADKHFDVTGFEAYYNDWVTIGGPKTDNLVIKFGTPTIAPTQPGTYTIGQCDVEHNTPTVIVYKPYWDTASQGDREELIWHELGHCLLGRYHDDRLRANGQPASIMNSIHFSPAIIGADPLYYRDELFSGK